MLLPLVAEPFTAPTDRDMLPSERREFVRTHRTCVFGYPRRHDGPAMSIVYYIPADNDELLVSTMAGRGKSRAVARAGKVSICVLDERWPFAYLQVYADACPALRQSDGRPRGSGCAALPPLRDICPTSAASSPQ